MQIRVRRGGKNSRVHTCWRPQCSPHGWALQHTWSEWAVMLVMACGLRGVLWGLFYYYYFIAISFINPLFLSLIYFNLFTKTTGFSPITVFSSAFLLKFLLPFSPSIFHSHPSHFLVTSHKAPPFLPLPPCLSLFHNQPFYFHSIPMFSSSWALASRLELLHSLVPPTVVFFSVCIFSPFSLYYFPLKLQLSRQHFFVHLQCFFRSQIVSLFLTRYEFMRKTFHAPLSIEILH